MKKLISILIVCTLIFHLFGYFAVFKVMQQNVKKQIKTSIKQGIPQEKLHSFRFPADKELQKKMGIRWHEKKEFSYKGKMYDIVYKLQDGNFIIYKCVNDTQEEALFAGLGIQIKNTLHSDPTKSKTLNILQKFNLLYYTQNQLKIKNSVKETQISFTYKPLFYYNLSQEVLTPPPQFS